jgi:hypothetical protein
MRAEGEVSPETSGVHISNSAASLIRSPNVSLVSYTHYEILEMCRCIHN